MKNRVIIVVAAVLAAALCMGLGAWGARKFFVLAKAPQDIASQLYAQKHPYIGRYPSRLIDLLTAPNVFSRNGAQLHTKKAPYGLELKYLVKDEAKVLDSLFSRPEDDRIFQHNALIIMALIDNCDFVMYTVDEETLQHYTRAWADALIGGDIKAQTGTEAEFRAFLAKLDSFAT